MRGTSIVAAGVAALVLFASAATADERGIADGDTAHGPLDIARVSHGHAFDDERRAVLVHTIEMHGSWSAREDLRGNEIIVYFDVDTDRGYRDYSGVTERRIDIFFSNGQLRANLVNNLGDPPKLIARLDVAKRDARTVQVEVRPDQLKRRGTLKRYWWGVQSLYSRRGHAECPNRQACSDQAPNRPAGYVRHGV